MATANQPSTSGFNDIQPLPSRKKGCMFCRKEVVVENFKELKRGDQIAMPGRMCLFGCLYNHHAIVANIEPVSDDKLDDTDRKSDKPTVDGKTAVNGKEANLTVVDVDGKGKTGVCLCNQKEYPVKEHGLYNKTKHELLTRRLPPPGPNEVVLRKVEYRKRKFDLEATYQRAHKCAQDIVKRQSVEATPQCTEESASQRVVKYHFCLQNCEHFASACVNGPDSLIGDSLAKSLSIQSIDCLLFAISFVFWALQAIFYGFNFWMYAVFVAKDPDFEFLTTNKGLRDCLERQCYSNKSSSHHFQTTCDWKMIGVFIGIFSCTFILMIICYYRPQYIKGYLCKFCFITVGIDLFFSRLVSFLLVEIICILLEDPLYRMVTGWKTSRVIIILILKTVSALGAVINYSLASLITKTMLWLCDKHSDCMKGKNFPDYVPFKGLMWCICEIRCCCRDANKKYVVDETEMTESVK